MSKKMYPYWLSNDFQSVGRSMADSKVIRAINRTGDTITPGSLLQFDTGYSVAAETASDGRTLPGTTNVLWGDPASCWMNLVKPHTDYLTQGWYCVAQEGAVDNAELSVMLWGETYMRVGNFSGYNAPFTNGTWTVATHTLTSSGNTFITNANFVPAAVTYQLVVTDGTDATQGTYDISSATSTTLVLATDIAAGNLATGDIAGYVKVNLPSGAKVEAAAATYGGKIANVAGSSRKIGITLDNTVYDSSLIAGQTQLVRVLFCGFGLDVRL